ncbi:MAG: hypothetical protein ACYCSF_02065 [Acidimicrobiales bacterium]
MSGYVEAGYLIVLVSLAAYSTTVVVRERAARARVGTDMGRDDRRDRSKDES